MKNRKNKPEKEKLLCHPSYLGGRNWEDCSLRQIQPKPSQELFSTNVWPPWHVPVIPITAGRPNGRISGEASLGNNFTQNSHAKNADGITQVVACLPTKGEAMRTIPTTTKTKQTITKIQ
jgi:hypothetical protein